MLELLELQEELKEHLDLNINGPLDLNARIELASFLTAAKIIKHLLERLI